MQPVQASTQNATPYFSSSTSLPSLGKIFKVVFLGFLATLGGASAQQTFQIGNHTTGLRRASCVEIGNGEIPCEWNKDGDLFREVFSPALEVAREQEMTQSGGVNSPSRLFKRLTGDYFSVWTTDELSNQGYDLSHNSNTNLEVYDLSLTYRPHTTVEGAVLASGESVMVTESDFPCCVPNNRFIIYWPLSTNLEDFGDPDPTGAVLADPSIIPAQESITSWITLLSTSGQIGKYRYAGFRSSNRISQPTSIFTSPGGTSTLRYPRGIQFGDGTYMAIFAKISETNQIEGYYYRRFRDDADNTLIDGADLPILEGDLGTWDQEDAILSVVPGENDTGWVTFIANDDVYVQQVDSSGKIGTAEPLGTTGAKEVSSFNITDGPGITWRNVSGLFGRIWNRVFPSPTPTPMPLISETQTTATRTPSESTNQGQSTDPTGSSRGSTEVTSSSTGGFSASSTTEESVANSSASSPPSTAPSTILPKSSMSTSVEILSTRGSSSSLGPQIDVEIIPQTVDPFVRSWEVIDGTLHITFWDTIDFGDEEEIPLFRFPNGQDWENLVLDAEVGSCVEASSRIEDNGDGTSSYFVLFEELGCGANAGEQVRPSWVSAFFGFFSGILGRVKNWV